VDKVENVGWSDVSCFPYGANFYDGTYTFDGVNLTLAAITGNSRCCIMAPSTWPFIVSILTETELVMSVEGEPEEVFTRKPGTAGDIVGLWSRDLQTFDFRGDSTFTGKDDPRCLEPVECGALPLARPVSPLVALAAHLPLLLPALLILLRKRQGVHVRLWKKRSKSHPSDSTPP
jgi:hypothetical protein